MVVFNVWGVVQIHARPGCARAPAGQPFQSGTARGVDTDPDSATTVVVGACVGGASVSAYSYFI
jgi:hypothetical protein